MIGVTWIHIAGGVVALFAGTVAIAVRKGSPLHRAAGLGFVVAMFVLGVTAALIGPFATPAQSPFGGLMVVYFVGTAWLAVRRRAAWTATLEKTACAFALLAGAAVVWEGVQRSLAPAGTFVDPPRPGALIAMGTVLLLAGLGDLRVALGRVLAPRQRVTRHLWRMCVSFFIATGSFFLGQMDVLPAALRHLPTLLVLAFAPFVAMLWFLARHRLSGYPLARRGPARPQPAPVDAGSAP